MEMMITTPECYSSHHTPLFSISLSCFEFKKKRFEHIEFKLNLIQQNAKFFLEVLAHQKSNSLEWIIIVLIMVECALTCMEMSGVGGPFFQYLKTFTPSILGG
jgi:uncharacterized Rmd1/YagE family protein